MKTQIFKLTTILVALFLSVSANAQNWVTLYETNFQGWQNLDAGGRTWINMDNGQKAWTRNTVTNPTHNPSVTNTTDLPTADIKGATSRGGSTNYIQLPALTFNNQVRITVYAYKTASGTGRNYQVFANQLGMGDGADNSKNDIPASGTTLVQTGELTNGSVTKHTNIVNLNGSYNINLFGTGGDAYLCYVRIETQSKGPYIEKFSLNGQDGTIDGVTEKITINDIPYATDLTQPVTPVITLGTGTAAGYTLPTTLTATVDPLVYTATYKVTSTVGDPDRTYTLTVNKKAASQPKDIKIKTFSVSYKGTSLPATVKTSTTSVLAADNTIEFTIPYTTTAAELNGTDLSNVFAPTYTTEGLICTAALATLPSPPCDLTGVKNPLGETVDLSKSIIGEDVTAPATYTIVAENGLTRTYTVKVTRAVANKYCSITDFALGIDKESLNINGTTITVTIPAVYQLTGGGVADLSNITPVITTNSISGTGTPPAKGIAIIPTDYSLALTDALGHTPVQITVQAEDLSEQAKVYDVIIVKDGTAPVFVSSSLTGYDCLSTPTAADEVNSLAGVIKLTYDEAIVAGTGAITLTGGTSNPLGAVTISDKEAKFNFSGLVSLVNYTLTIPAGFFTDKYGNAIAQTEICFRTADGTLKNFPYSGCMEGENFAVPAFISGVTYNPTVDTKATTPNQYGAYEIPAGGSLVINTEQAGTIVASVYALGGNRNYTITTTASVNYQTGGLNNYENRGKSIQLQINQGNAGGTPFDIKINNIGSGSIFIPFIYISENGQPGMTTNEACCK